MSDIEFETDRLILREWRETDKSPFADMNSDPIVMEYFPTIRTREESDTMVDMCASVIEANGFGFMAVELKTSGEFIGFVGLNPFAVDLPFCPCVEIGWRLALDYWGQGFATEAAKKWLELGFERFALSEIVSFTAIQNHRSRNVMTKIGLIDSDQNFKHPKVPEESGLQEHCYIK